MSDASFTLFHYPLSRSTRVKWLLHEIFAENFDERVTVQKVAVLRGEQYTPEYLAMNPNHAVPVLRVYEPDGESYTIIESGAIVSWLADAFRAKGLAPPAGDFSAARADYLQMLHFACSSVDMMLWQLRLQLNLLPEEQRDDATIERYREKYASEVEPQLRRRLESNAWICGTAFSAADCVTGHNINWSRAYGLSGDPVFAEYLARLAERPAYLAAYADREEFGKI